MLLGFSGRCAKNKSTKKTKSEKKTRRSFIFFVAVPNAGPRRVRACLVRSLRGSSRRLFVRSFVHRVSRSASSSCPRGETPQEDDACAIPQMTSWRTPLLGECRGSSLYSDPIRRPPQACTNLGCRAKLRQRLRTVRLVRHFCFLRLCAYGVVRAQINDAAPDNVSACCLQSLKR